MPLRLLHLSDIHFHAGSPGWDEDRDLRDELVRDVQSLVLEHGRLDAVLVGGDIAFSAQEAEYAIALEWIDAILAVSGGIGRSQVWTVPGNHDVDRSVVMASKDVQEFHEEMASCDPAGGVDSILRRRIADEVTADGLMMPLAEYNRFAENFVCTTQPSSLAWQDNSLSVDGFTVRLTGINSVMNSGPGDSFQSLVVGTQQCRLPRAEGTVHVAMLHHPPRWIKDWGVIEPYLNRAHVVLFGHEHAFEAEQPARGGTVRVSAGAVAPERDERGEVEPFVPTFNLVTLARDDDQLRVEIHPRYWSKTRTRFDEHPNGSRSYAVDIDPAIPPTGPLPSVADIDAGLEITSASPLIAPSKESATAKVTETAEDRRSLREIGVNFLALGISERLRVAKALGVVDTEDLRLPSRNLYPLILRRIRERGLIDELITELNK